MMPLSPGRPPITVQLSRAPRSSASWSSRAVGAVLCAVVGACDPEPSPRASEVVNVSEGSAVLATWDGGSVTLPELEERLHDELARLEATYLVERYEKLHQALDGAVEEALLASEVARRGLPDVASLLEAEVEARIGEPTEEEIRTEYARFVEQVPAAELEASRPFLRKELRDARRHERRRAYLEELKASRGLHVRFPYPAIPRAEVPVDPHDATLGDPLAAITIVVFSGFECLYCKRVEPTMRRVVESYAGKVRLVVKDFPLPGHGHAEVAAIAAHCAGDQGRYWEMSDLLFANQGRFELAHLTEYADRLGLDRPRWQSCVNDPAWHKRIAEDVHLGRRIGVQSTPTFYFNGLPVAGAHAYERFAAIVDQELLRASAMDESPR